MAKNKQCVVFDGRNPGIYDSWDDANAQISGFPRNSFKSFKTPQEAQNAWNNKTSRGSAAGVKGGHVSSPESTSLEDKLSDLTIAPQGLESDRDSLDWQVSSSDDDDNCYDSEDEDDDEEEDDDDEDNEEKDDGDYGEEYHDEDGDDDEEEGAETDMDYYSSDD